MGKIKIHRIYNEENDDDFETLDESKLPIDDEFKSDSNMDNEILSNLISLSSVTKNIKQINDDKDDKKKKKKKKKDKKKKKKLDISELNLFDNADGNSALPVNKKKVEKTNDDFYEYRFSGSLILLKNLLVQINKTIDDSQDYLDGLKKGVSGKLRTHVTPTAITNQTANMATLFSTKLNTIKEIGAVNKNISELELKKLTQDIKQKDKEADPEKDSKFIIDQMLGELNKVKPKKKKTNKKKSDALLDSRIDELEKKGDIEFSDNEKAFKYENADKQISIKIKKYPSTNEWEFEAIDEDDNVIDDYPLPDKSAIGNVKFDKEKSYATDQLGNSYEVVYMY